MQSHTFNGKIVKGILMEPSAGRPIGSIELTLDRCGFALLGKGSTGVA